jgi:hypothetical protein
VGLNSLKEVLMMLYLLLCGVRELGGRSIARWVKHQGVEPNFLS